MIPWREVMESRTVASVHPAHLRIPAIGRVAGSVMTVADPVQPAARVRHDSAILHPDAAAKDGTSSDVWSRHR
jgi:hypothetical protein